MAVVLLAGLQVDQVLLAVLSLAPHAPVQDAHDGGRRVIRRYGRAHRQVFVGLQELDVALVCRTTQNQRRRALLVIATQALDLGPPREPNLT